MTILNIEIYLQFSGETKLIFLYFWNNSEMILDFIQTLNGGDQYFVELTKWSWLNPIFFSFLLFIYFDRLGNTLIYSY